MRVIKISSCIALIMLFTSACVKNVNVNPNEKLVGNWKVTQAQGQLYSNGTPGLMLTDTATTGNIQFNSNGTGKSNFSFALFGVVFPNVYNFSYTVSDAEVRIKQYGKSDLIWTRVSNENNVQVAYYTINLDATQNVRCTLTLKK